MPRRRVGFQGWIALLALAIPLAAPGLTAPAGAAPSTSRAVVPAAIAFIASQQRVDGGFGAGEEGFPGFETPDAVLAIADAAQSSVVYDPMAALAAVRSIRKGGRDGLNYLDDLADGGVSAGKAAQLVAVAGAVGLNPEAFDPDGDGSTDLVATMDAGRQPDRSYGTFNDDLSVLVAHTVLQRPAPDDLVVSIFASQQANGGWSFTGDPSGSSEDVDTTSRAVAALATSRSFRSETGLQQAIAFLATLQRPDGGWDSFGAPDPNSTAMAVLAITAAGFDVDRPCWRGSAGPAPAYRSPDDFLRAAQAPDGRIASPADDFGVNTFATSQSMQALLRDFQPVARAQRKPCPTTGYRLVGADGGVFTFGDAGYFGSTGDIALNRPIVSAAATSTSAGYWLFASDGGVFTFGDAGYFGSTGDIALNQPIVAGAPTPTGGGYALFAADGGVFTFGDAAFLGSTGGRPLNSPVVGGEMTPSGAGYWLFASDGGVFTFGDAGYFGAGSDRGVDAPIVAGAASVSGAGYCLFSADGRIFSLGVAGCEVAAVTGLNRPVVSGVRSAGTGFYRVASDGGLFTLGDAPFFGSLGDRALNAPIVGATL